MRQRHKTPYPFFPEMEAFNDPLTLGIGYPSSLGSSFVIEIQTHAKIGLERICKNKMKSQAGLRVAYTSATLKP